jgi:hypothetical protein
MKKSSLIIFVFSVLILMGCTQAEYSNERNAVECGDTITENTILAGDLLGCNGEYGLIIGSNNITLDCTGYQIGISEFGFAIYINNFDYVEIKNCNFVDYEIGILARSTSNSIIYNNTFSAYGDTEIELSGSSNNTIIESNNFNSESTYGVQISASEIEVYNNTFDNGRFHSLNTWGSRNKIHGNQFIGNAEYGIITTGANNTMWDNIFNGTYNISSSYEPLSAEDNYWNNSNTGNYWSDFTDNPGFPNYYEISGEGTGVDYKPILGFCSDGTPSNQCSEDQPWFCAVISSNPIRVGLKYNCRNCGCPSGEYCNPINGMCSFVDPTGIHGRE